MACLAPELAKTKVSISLPSLRAEAFSVALADAVSEVRKSGFTFAPETGSDRLRRVINKTFTNDDMVKAAGVAFERGWDLIKVYTMIGLPSETTADLDELVTLVANILAEGRKKGVRATVHVSIGSYVPKSFTPFQWSAFDGVEQLSEKLVYLREKFRPVRGAKLKWHEPKEAEIEAMLSLGDRRMSKALLEVWKRGGKFDGWSEHFSWERWTEALEAAGIPKERHLRQKDLKETLPWDVVDASIRKPFLVVEWKKALQEMATDDCKWGRCTACGVPGNGEDTVLANGMPEGFTFALPSLAQVAAAPSSAGVAAGVTDARDEGRGSAYADKAKGAAYRMKATPDLLPLRERRRHRGGASESAAIAKTWRVSFEKLGDARYLSHRNVMDILERAFRAARVPVRYTEGFNPHIRLSMGPALPLGQESRHELFDLDVVDTLAPEFLAAVNDRLPPGMRLLGWNELPAGLEISRQGRDRGRLPLHDAQRRGADAAPAPVGRRRDDAEALHRDDVGTRRRGPARHPRRPRGDGPDALSAPTGTLMPFTIRCHATFEAAHHLRDYVGGPEPVHGHSWKIEVALGTDSLGAYDLSVDFVPTEKLVRQLAARLHDRDINSVPPFDAKNPTAENVALWVAEEIRASGHLKDGARLEEVTVWEGPRNSVTWRP